MKITNQQNYSYKNPSFGYNFFKHSPRNYNHGDRVRSTTKTYLKRKAKFVLELGDVAEYRELLGAIKEFRDARFDATGLIKKILPLMQKFKLEGEFNELLNKFDAPVNKKGEKDFSKINASLSDIFYSNGAESLIPSENLFENINGVPTLKAKNIGRLNFYIDCGHKISGISDYEEASRELLRLSGVSDIKDLKKRVDTKITDYFIEECQNIIRKDKERYSKAQKCVNTDFDELFK